MLNLFKILFFNLMIIGTFITISAYSWLASWIGLEINLLSLIPLLKNNKNKFPTEAAMKYFIAQVMGSSLLLFAISIYMLSGNSMMEKYELTELIILSSALLLKTGTAPFHFWFPEVMSGLNWNNAFILLTWQKIAPMILLSYQIKQYTLFFSMIIILSSMIGSIQGLNQVCLRKIMAYSSINHLSWMISSLLSSVNIFIYYFLTYSIINASIILILKKFNIFFMNQLTNMFTFKKKIKFFFMLNFLSLGGLPPFLGFLPKWLVINSMINNNYYFIMTSLIVISLITLYFYLRITFPSFTLFSQETLIIIFNKLNYMQLLFNSLSLMGLIMCNMIISFF